jgi:hypothetical protein
MLKIYFMSEALIYVTKQFVIDGIDLAHPAVQNRFNQERQIFDREIFKLQLNAALSEWQQFCAA